jgi:Spy/CpxP family protein refolding chaperone
MKLRWIVAVSAALMLALGGTAAIAQEKGAQQEDAIHAKMAAMQQELQHLLVKIDATEAQSTQIFEIRHRFEHERLQLSLAGTQTRQEKLHFKAIQDEAAKAIGNVLSPEQIQKLQPLGGIPALLGQGEGAGPWDILRKLDLSVDQRIQLKQIIARVTASMEAIKGDQTLSGEQIKAKMEELHHGAIAQVQAILTPAQQARLRELMDEQSKGHKINPS